MQHICYFTVDKIIEVHCTNQVSVYVWNVNDEGVLVGFIGENPCIRKREGILWLANADFVSSDKNTEFEF